MMADNKEQRVCVYAAHVSPTENRNGTSLDADKSHIYFNFTDVFRVKRARSPQVRDEDCTPNLVKNVKETQHLVDLSRY